MSNSAGHEVENQPFVRYNRFLCNLHLTHRRRELYNKNCSETYRSGCNEPHSKCGCPQGHVGSNPTVSVFAYIVEILDIALGFPLFYLLLSSTSTAFLIFSASVCQISYSLNPGNPILTPALRNSILLSKVTFPDI